MDLTGIISISGKPGLYKVVGQSKSAMIVESLEDGKKFPAHSSNRVSSLGDISFYTVEEDVPLEDVFASIFNNLDGKKALDHKSSPEELRTFMEKVYPNYDKERVYNSDLKKLIQWYNSLLEAGIIKKEDLPDEKAGTTSEEIKTEENATTENTHEA